MGRRALFEKFISGLKGGVAVDNELEFNIVKYKFNRENLELTDMLSILGSTGLNINVLYQNMEKIFWIFGEKVNCTLLIKLFDSKLFYFYLKIILCINEKKLSKICKGAIIQYRLLCLGDRFNFFSVVKNLFKGKLK